jgi:glutamyl-tRNA reductase
LNFILAGLNIERSPVEFLESVAIPAQLLKGHLSRLATHAGGGVILSTCNRTEVYAVADDVEVGIRQLKEFIEDIPGNSGTDDPGELAEHIYTLTGDDVATHLFNVTSGLHSVALGESQILGQVSRALQAAGEAGAVEPVLSRMFHAALRTSRRVRKESGLGRNRLSISSLGVQELQRVAGELEGLRVLLVGAGETGKLTARALRRYGADDIVVTSRSMNRSSILAEELGSPQIPFDQISSSLAATDVLITCTAAPDSLISADAIRSAMSARPDRPMYILDVGMPRDVDPAASGIAGVTLISLSELQAKSAQHKGLREEAAAKARVLIEDGVRRFKERLAGLDSEPVIRILGARVEQMRRQEVEQTLGRIDDLTDEQSVAVEKMTRSLVRRILADPISFLRSEEASAADAVQKVFALRDADEEDESETD